jgi:putative ABC transport system permease protein
MWRIVVKGLIAHKLRLALTALAIVLGVTFISGTFILTDTLHSTFTALFSRAYEGVNFEVRAKAAFQGDLDAGTDRRLVPQALAALVRSVPGVGYVDGSVNGYAQFVSPDGKAVGSPGAPALGFSFDPNGQLSSLHLVRGSAPTSPHDLVMDVGTARKYHFEVGERVRVLLAGPSQTFRISGLVSFGTSDNLAGATLAAFSLPTAQVLFDARGQYDAIDVLAAPDADKPRLEQAIAKVLPPGVEVVTGQTVAGEQTSAVMNNGLSVFSTALLVFAFVSLFVGGFTIFNTFSITVSQRSRELALLRVVGASRRQVFRSVLGEAVLVGLAASLVGLGLGVLAAVGLEVMLRAFGISLPSGPLVFEPRTAVVALGVGVGVTVVAALTPARRAVRVPAVTALADQSAGEADPLRRRVTIGSIVGGAGLACLLGGLGTSSLALVGLGALSVFVAAGMLAPIVARPMAGAIGRPIAGVLGSPGRLGRENSMRSPRRTAQTGAALMVGLSLVATVAVFGASLSRSATSSVNDAVSADYIVTSSSAGDGEFSNAVETAALLVHGAAAVSTVYDGQFELGHSLSELTAVSTVDLPDTVILAVTHGRGAAALAAGELLVDSTTATTKHLSVGSVVAVTFARTGKSTITVGGIFKPNALLGSYVVGDGLFLAHFTAPMPVAVLVAADRGARNFSHALGVGLKAFPGLQVQTRAQFDKAEQAQVNQLLGLVYALLALAVVIALTGIVNTLMLSVFERTHEIGLLRAVGMKRRQVRAMVRCESVIIAVFGALSGCVIGTGLGCALAASLKQQGVTDIVVPFSTLFTFLALSALLGLVAASWPARRAAKLDVLAAIASQ